MKRINFFLLALLIPVTLSAAGHELFSVESTEWKAASALCVANGVLPPPSVSPCTSGEIETALSRIPGHMLDSDERLMLEELLGLLHPSMALEDTWVGLDPSLTLAPEIYAHTRVMEQPQDFLWGLKDMQHDLEASMKVRMGETGWAYADWAFLAQAIDFPHEDIFSHNMEFGNAFQHEAIFDCGLVLGNDFLRAMVMRTGQSMGYGKTGNLMVADNFTRQDFLRGTLRSRWFDYTLNITSFEATLPMEGPAPDVSFSGRKFNGKNQSQAIHRFSFKMFDRADIVFQEGIMLYSDSALDLRLFNPFIFFHGLSNYSMSDSYDPSGYDEENNYVTAEAGWTVVPHMRFTFQLLMDQIQLREDKESPDAIPQAYGLLWNIESPWIKGRHYVDAWYEGVLIMPACYLNDKKYPDGRYETNLDMITGYSNKQQDEVGYAGYRYGPDSIVNAVGVSWGMPGTYSCDFSLLWLIHGQYGYGYRTMIPAKGPEHFSDMPLAGIGFDGAEHRVEVKLDASYEPFDWLRMDAGLGFVCIVNHGTEKGRDMNDLQLKLGVTLDPFALLRH